MKQFSAMSRRAFLKLSVLTATLCDIFQYSFSPPKSEASSGTHKPAPIRPIRIGGGGYVTGFDQHTDGTIVCRCDVFGAYIWDNHKDKWLQLVRYDSMPASERGPEHYDGVYEICIAPSNSNIFYMAYFGYVFRSNDKGSTWTRCAEVNGSRLTNLGGNHNTRWITRKMAIDPVNPDVVYLGTNDHGLWRTQDGGTTWIELTDVPISVGSASDPGIAGIIFDPTSSTTTTNGETVTTTLWAASFANGYYRSTDGGMTWSKPTGGPATAVEDANFDSTGKLYCVSYSTENKLWRWDGSWTDLTANVNSSGLRSCLVDPFDDNRLLVIDGAGLFQESLDAGENFGSKFTLITTIDVTGDVLWLDEHGTSGDNIVVGRMLFHPTQQHRLRCSSGVGFFYTDLVPDYYPLPGAIVWHSMTRGIEELVAQWVCSTPNGDTFLAAQDRPLWKIVNPDAFPKTELLTGNPHIAHCSSLDYLSSDPDFIYIVTTNVVGYSEDAGENWTVFSAIPNWGGKPLGPWPNSHYYGELKASSKTNFVWFPGSAKQPYFTLDGGETWTGMTFPDVLEDATDNGWGGFNFSNYTIRHHNCTPDRSVPLKFYVHHYSKGVFVTTDGGANWTRIKDTPVTSFTGFHIKMRNPENHAGHLWITPGPSSAGGTDHPYGSFARSNDGGRTWESIPNVLEVWDFNFGAPAPGSIYPTIIMVGYVNLKWGLYRTTNANVAPASIVWERISDFSQNSLDAVTCLDGDKRTFGKYYLGFAGSGFGYTVTNPI